MFCVIPWFNAGAVDCSVGIEATFHRERSGIQSLRRVHRFFSRWMVCGVAENIKKVTSKLKFPIACLFFLLEGMQHCSQNDLTFSKKLHVIQLQMFKKKKQQDVSTVSEIIGAAN